MKYAEFKNEVENGNAFSVYLFEGEDAFFREKGLSLLKKSFITEPEINCVNFDGDKLNPKEVFSSLEQYPFLSNFRLTVVREYYPKKETLGDIESFFVNPLSGSILAIVNEKPCELFKKYPSVITVDCGKSDSSTIARWVKGQCQLVGVEIDLQTAKTLAEYCALDMTRVENETQKLISFAFTQKVITLNDVEELVSKDAEYKIYEMTEYIGKKDFEKALEVITDMLAKGETMQRLFVSIYNYFRRLLHVAISTKSDIELAQMLSIKEFAVKKARAQANKFTKRALKKAVDALIETDYNVKNGNADVDNRIWLNVFSIMVEGV